MNKADDPHSIHSEPHWKSGGSRGESIFEEPALTGRSGEPDDEDRANHNVWDEPASRSAGYEAPEDAHTYARWYREGLELVSLGQAWVATLLLAFLGGPLALLGAIFPTEPQGLWSMLAVVTVGPVMEEMLKISAVAIALERRPFLFRSAGQILVAVLASAALFGVVENLLYIYVWIPDPTPAMIAWRWSVCTALHVSATAIAGLGMARMWRVSLRRMERVQMRDAFPYLVTAILVHCAYNGLAAAYEAFFNPF